MAYTSGKFGSVEVGSTSYGFNYWKFPMKVPSVKTNNFKTPAQQVVPGLPGTEITIRGAYDVGDMNFVSGEYYTFLLGISDSLKYTVRVLVTNLELTEDVEGTPQLEITGDSDGEFDLEIDP